MVGKDDGQTNCAFNKHVFGVVARVGRVHVFVCVRVCVSVMRAKAAYGSEISKQKEIKQRY